MTFKLLFQLGLVLATILQLIFALSAEVEENYTQAIYELLWVFFFLFLLDKELTHNG